LAIFCAAVLPLSSMRATVGASSICVALRRQPTTLSHGFDLRPNSSPSAARAARRPGRQRDSNRMRLHETVWSAFESRSARSVAQMSGDLTRELPNKRALGVAQRKPAHSHSAFVKGFWVRARR
jgi:hypothetical protein